MQVGRPSGWFSAVSSAAQTASRSWPSSSTSVRQPKASHLARNGSVFIVSCGWPSEPAALMSTMPIRLSRPQCAAEIAASQIWPSVCSPSPIRHTVRAGEPRRRVPSAMPTETDRLWPIEPDEKSTPGTFFMSGWSPSGDLKRV